MKPITARWARTFAGSSYGAAVSRPIVGALALALAGFALGCDAGTGGMSNQGQADTSPPRITMSPAAAPNDSSVAFSAMATDNLGLLSIRVSVTGPNISATFDTTFHTAVTSITIPYTLALPTTVPSGTTLTVVGNAVDGAHNVARPDTIFIIVGGGTPANVVLTNPRAGDTAVVGFTVAVSISGRTQRGVKVLGYNASGVFPQAKRDSVVFASPLKDSIAVDTALSLVGASTGTLTIQPFMIDSLGQVILGAPVNVVVSNTAAGTIPVVTFGITQRIEVTDTIHVEARDRGGVRWLGYEIRSLPSDPVPLGPTGLVADSFQVTGNASSAVKTFTLNLPVTQFPKIVQVQAFATNQQGRRDYARNPVGNSGAIIVDTVIVVAGLTRGLPNGGQVADALYHPPTNRLYLSNITNNQLEVFDLGDSTFKTPIITGSRPWGLAPWPRDRSGTMGDTILVANSGGTLISYVNVAGNADQEVFRYPLPNIIVNTVTTTLGKNGALITQRTAHDFSDRPQFLATTCTGGLAPGSPCGDVVVVYTTTPTTGQSVPFSNMGTVRWENLTRSSSHFFFEQAIGQTEGQADTLEIIRFQAGGAGSDSVLVPFRQGPFLVGADTAFFSVVIQIPLMGFRDTTFTRGSGNFRRAVIGEGGAVGGNGTQANSRAMLYDESLGFVKGFRDLSGNFFLLPIPVQDSGVSRPVDVSDFIANTATQVSSVAINFDGEMSGIRADSTYLVDRTLRLQGLLQTSGGNPGLDFHPQNAGVSGPGPAGGTKVAFAASFLPQIDVFNTNTYRVCMSIPTRDPIIGPLKAALQPGGTIVITGATQSGVVIVTLTQVQLNSCN
ncbi:MAG TPA: hypothetical protein VEI06_10190 [Gemmatimonadaceae bacterium]|nr:hypothetical protein [Gemmatimonadaceae bacterium]